MLVEGSSTASSRFAITVTSENWDEIRKEGFEWIANLDMPIDKLSDAELVRARHWYDPENVLVGETYDDVRTHRPVQTYGRAALYGRRPAYVDNHMPMEVDPVLGPVTIAQRPHPYNYPGREQPDTPLFI